MGRAVVEETVEATAEVGAALEDAGEGRKGKPEEVEGGAVAGRVQVTVSVRVAVDTWCRALISLVAALGCAATCARGVCGYAT